MPRSTLRPVRKTFRAVATAVLPSMDELGGGGWSRAEEIIEEALADRPPTMGRQLRLFLRVLNWLPVPVHLRTFRGLDPRRRVLFLRRLETFPLLKVRQGLWGLRTLVFMGYYGQAGTYGKIGYRAHLRGRDARGGLDPETGRRRADAGPDPGGGDLGPGAGGSPRSRGPELPRNPGRSGPAGGPRSGRGSGGSGRA